MRRIERESIEFGRIVNLSDGVFAIAMTLLVLGLDVPDVGVAPLAEQVVALLPNLIAFSLGFALIANIWWAHHKLLAQVRFFEPVSMGLNLVFLGVVALVPFPTGLVGAAPTERAAVVPFIFVFVVLMVVAIAMIARMQATRAWREALEPRMYRWVLAGWLAELSGMVLALLVALVWPVGGLLVAAAKGPVIGGLFARLAPPEYAAWS